MPEDRVLISDYQRWYIVLNGSFLADDEQEDDAMESMPPTAEAVEQSWERIFDIERGDPEYHLHPADRMIQATLWFIARSEVRAITSFTAR